MSAYGFEIVQTLIVDTEPDEHVKKAISEVNAGKCSFSIEHCFSSLSSRLSFLSLSLIGKIPSLICNDFP